METQVYIVDIATFHGSRRLEIAARSARDAARIGARLGLVLSVTEL